MKNENKTIEEQMENLQEMVKKEAEEVATQKIEDTFEAKLKEFEDKLKDGANVEEVKSQLANLSEKYNEAQEISKKENEEIHAELKKLREFKNDNTSETLTNRFERIFTEKENEIKEWREGQNHSWQGRRPCFLNPSQRSPLQDPVWILSELGW